MQALRVREHVEEDIRADREAHYAQWQRAEEAIKRVEADMDNLHAQHVLEVKQY
jgi:hypothetical protein